MKLVIEEQFWSVEGPTRTTNKVKVPAVVGKIPGMERHGMYFTVDAVTEEGVQVTVHYKNEKYNKTWTVTKDQGVYYRPMSMDGGYEYFIDLKPGLLGK